MSRVRSELGRFTLAQQTVFSAGGRVVSRMSVGQLASNSPHPQKLQEGYDIWANKEGEACAFRVREKPGTDSGVTLGRAMRICGRSAIAVVALACGLAAIGHEPARATTATVPAVPAYDHVVVLVEENENASATFADNSPAHYLNSLRAKGAFVPGYYGTGHVSLDNYIAMVSGEPNNVVTNTDCLTVSLYTCAQSTMAFSNGRHLGDQLDDAGITWKSYMDGTPSPCFHAPYGTDLAALVTPDPYQGNSQTPPAKDYADRHNPFIYFPDFVGNDSRCAAHQRPYTELSGDLAADTLPAFSFITPDTCHDGHDATCSDGSPGGLVGADAWLSINLPPLLTYLQSHNGLLIINFDEGAVAAPSPTAPPADSACSTCVSGGLGGRTGAIVIGPGVTAGKTVASSYDHHSLLRTIEDSFGLAEHLNLAAQATPMTDVFLP